ncbi:hypothetical protein [Sphingomicrobium sediminis]|uniref:Uncharacterized protein n=1 Tax=Sphingomicrobium sediminis TaxID=2950949 RepID=A0A9X2EGV7_9SPHN|nr:hypothetical protein [Sphingomicrobium sediminis]MCM8557778.1 hypothetical protein [Sphingomicrobium sediminis]
MMASIAATFEAHKNGARHLTMPGPETLGNIMKKAVAFEDHLYADMVNDSCIPGGI